METLLINLAVVLVSMTLLWGVSLILRDASIVDPCWGMGFLLVAWVSYWLQWPGTTRLLLACGMITIWGLRLSGHLFWRNSGEAEDPRYAAMREKHGQKFWWVSLLTVFLLQGFLMWFISLPIQIIAVQAIETPLGWLDAVGVVVWLVGLFFETLGDWQLSKFRSDPNNQGKVLNQGLWYYTRHPNYFGDFCIWWGIYLVSISGGGWLTFFSPLLMSVFLLKVSGVTLLEKDITSRRPGYAEYQRRTSAFFPWPPAR